MNWIVQPMNYDPISPEWCLPVVCTPVVCSEKQSCPTGSPGVCYCWGGYGRGCDCKGGPAYALPSSL